MGKVIWPAELMRTSVLKSGIPYRLTSSRSPEPRIKSGDARWLDSAKVDVGDRGAPVAGGGTSGASTRLWARPYVATRATKTSLVIKKVLDFITNSNNWLSVCRRAWSLRRNRNCGALRN